MTDSRSSSPDEKATVAHRDDNPPKGGVFSRLNDEQLDEKDVEVATDVNSQEKVTEPVSFSQLFR
jgi:hypothetical protein